jgi:hypothetical protein
MFNNFKRIQNECLHIFHRYIRKHGNTTECANEFLLHSMTVTTIVTIPAFATSLRLPF